MTTLTENIVLTPESDRWEEFIDQLCEKTNDSGCDNSIERPNACAVLESMGGIDIPKTLAYFEDNGGYCDCEIIMNVDR